MRYKITNKTFQPLQIVMGTNETHIIEGRAGNNVIFLNEINKQIRNLEKKGLVKVREYK
jgi:ribosomal protein L35